MKLKLSDIDCELSAQGSVFMPHTQTLLLADIHFGKDYAIIKDGRPIPAGATAENLFRLNKLIAEYKPERVVFLGDLFHIKSGTRDELVTTLKEFTCANSAINFVNVTGNHDRFISDLENITGIKSVDELEEPPFFFVHEPRGKGHLFTLAGHIHPTYSFVDVNRQKIKLKIFYLTKQQMILPAFGVLTGGYEIKPEAGSRVIALSESEIFELPIERLYSSS